MSKRLPFPPPDPPPLPTQPEPHRASKAKAKDYTDPRRHGSKAKGGPIERIFPDTKSD